MEGNNERKERGRVGMGVKGGTKGKKEGKE
jgi:hypothetical protein